MVQEPMAASAVEAVPVAPQDTARPEGAVLDAAASTGAAESKPSDEQAFIEVWRPGGRPERRPHRPRRQQASPPTPDAATVSAVAPVEGAAVSAPADAAQQPGDSRRPRVDRQQRQDRHERQQKLERQGKRVERQDGGGPRRERPRRDRGERVDRADREQYYAKPFGSSGGRDKQPDPNSPFAKLAALKQQLEQNTKES
jgi:ATP-dependent RNA helicase SUPV3L1/SUV3